MDQITQLSRKMLVERARQNLHQSPLPEVAPPPPYTSDSENDSEDDEDEDEETQSPLKLTINAAHSIQGSNNLVPTSATPLADATKFSSLLLHAVNQINDAANAAGTRARRNLNVDLTINCGITVVGDRNVIGNVGLRPRASPFALPAPPAELRGNAMAGAKRKGEEGSEDEQEPKRVAVENASAA